MNWISVKDKLPEKGVIVIVSGGVAMYTDTGWYTLTGYDYPGKKIMWVVRNWMPIPTIPETETTHH